VGANAVLTLISLAALGLVSYVSGAVVGVYVIQLLLVLGTGIVQGMAAIKLGRRDPSMLRHAHTASAATAGMLIVLLIVGIAISGTVYALGLIISLLTIGGNVAAFVMAGRARKSYGV
jgi:hypothetical protein